MVRIRSTNDLVLSSIDFYRTAIPNLDTKPGTVSRDLFIDGPSTQVARLYEELARVKSAQSLRLSLGNDIDLLGSNFKLPRKQGSKSSGIALLTFSSIDSDIQINKGNIVSASNGSSFSVVNGITVSAVNLNTYRATASKFRADLDFVGIDDEYAVEVAVECTVTGNTGNVAKYSLNSTTISGVSGVTNYSSFRGGSQSETDAEYKNRILAVFGGANTGTAAGYLNIVKADPQVIDAVVIGPGDELMTRDGTQVHTAEDGTKTITSEGTGGKVDIYVYGIRLIEILDSFIYRDQSNKSDPTDPSNDFVLGQIEEDENKTVSKRRIDNLASGVLPDQPVNNIVQVTGSSSGSNFVEKETDSLGRVTGNYELIRDRGAYGGSPWSFDKIRWIDDRIRDFSEEQTKGRFNGQDATGFADVLKIGSITENIQIINENANVSPSDRTSVQLAHYPILNVDRIFNLSTGERYIVTDQNPDGEGSINETGRITISGSTLPSVNHILQADYSWIFEYNSDFDFDNRHTSDNPRQVVDSVDWGYSNAVRREESTIELSSNQKLVTVTHPVTSVISVNTFTEEAGVVSLISDRLSVTVDDSINNVISVVRSSDGAELYNTSNDDGSFSGFNVFLPTDTVAEVGDTITIRYNADDVFTVNGVSGSFSSNTITLPSSDVAVSTIVEVNYIANIRELLPPTLLPALPAIKNENGFNTSSSNNIGIQPTTHVYESSEIIQNLREAPTRLKLVIAGSISPGTITVSGTTFTLIEDVFTAGVSGLVHNLSSIIKNNLDIASTSSLPDNVSVVKLVSLERVTTSGNNVLTVEHDYDIKGYKLLNNSFSKKDSVTDVSLTRTEVELPETLDNISEAPELGNRFRIRFYIATTDDSENVSFSKSGTLYTQKTYALIDTIAISSGFTSGPSETATLTVSSQNQPAQGTRYSLIYDYLAPKQNERISINYNKNSVINDITLAIEEQRPIGSDVLGKASFAIFVDIELAIVVTKEYKNSSAIVKQNVKDAVTSALNASSLGTIVDFSDFVDVACSVAGVDRVRVLYFNIDGNTGSVLSIEAEKNEYIQANEVNITIEER